MSLKLPYPPSANTIWRVFKGRAIKSAKYRAWLERAQDALRAQDAGEVHGPYRLTIIATRPDRRRRDIGNLEKPISDALQAYGVIKDDSEAQSIFVMWSADKPNPKAGVSVTLERAWSP